MSWQEILAGPALEYVGTALAVVSVILIARQRILGWPLGILWALLSSWLAYSRWNLFSDAVLYASFVPLQIYCWTVWYRHGAKTATFRPSWLSRRAQIVLILVALVSVLLWGWGVIYLSEHLRWIATPALLWRDATTTVLNYFAQFLQAKKRMENWIGWLVVNVLGIHIYATQGAYVYAAQYGFFLILGLYGWWSWSRAMKHDAI
jgi:nicotinamide mononucleotide transporter